MRVEGKPGGRAKKWLVGGAIVAAVGLYVFLGAIGGGSWYEPLRERIERARSATSGERLLEGTVVADGQTIRSPYGVQAVAVARWQRTRRGDHHGHGNLQLDGVPFTLRTTRGDLRVDGQVVGVTDLVRQVQGPTGEVACSVGPGDHASVLGVVTESNGRPGFYGEVFIAKGTYDELYEFIGKETIVSFRDDRW